MSFEKRIFIVTGAASGIGKACAAKLLQAGALVAGLDVNPLGIKHSAYSHHVVDVGEEASVLKTVDRTEVDIGPIHGLVNAAGIFSCGKPFFRMSLVEWQKVVTTNLTGTFLCSRAVAEKMIERKQGRIVNISCIRSRVVSPNMADYAASKGGVVSLTAAMAVDLAPHNIRVNSVAPGFTLTGMTERAYGDPQVRQKRGSLAPLGRIADASEIADVALFLLSESSSYVTGETIFVDGGMSVFR